MKRTIYIAEPVDETQRHWNVMAHNLDEAADVVVVAGPFESEAQATEEAQRLQEMGRSGRL
jgi:hypothetical protein